MLVTVNCSYVQILQQALISAHVKVRGWAGVAVVPPPPVRGPARKVARLPCSRLCRVTRSGDIINIITAA